MGGSMKVHPQFAGGPINGWDHNERHEPFSSSLSLGICKRLRPLIPKRQAVAGRGSSGDVPFDLKNFIKPDCGRGKTDYISSYDDKRESSNQVETHPGGTRWNPTQEQIGILEMLYREGTRTPNAQQIEQITTQLGKYGKIEGKNVFYWFQNHKARERQKQKRHSLGLGHSSWRSSTKFTTITLCTRAESHLQKVPITFRVCISPRSNQHSGKKELVEENPMLKRKCKTWTYEKLQEDKSYMSYSREDDESEKSKTLLQLFPLHPEGRDELRAVLL